jgi:hypothetical protein
LPAILVSELVVHGLDIARTTEARWDISSESARLSLSAGTHLLPYFVDPAEARGFRATYRVKVRGGPHHFMVFEGPKLEFWPGGRHLPQAVVVIPDSSVHSFESRRPKPDCTISVDPVTYLLLGTRRIGLVRAALTGRVITYGRKPWLGLKLQKLFANP